MLLYDCRMLLTQLKLDMEKEKERFAKALDELKGED